MGLSVLLMVLSFAVILAGAVLFTNAVEWAGVRLNLGHGAVGSILAAVATAMPESAIPVVAIVSGEQAGPIATGAIIGAPFLLGTLAMALIGLSAWAYRRRREQGVRLHLDRTATRRDLTVFLAALGLALLLGLIGNVVLNLLGALVLVVAYGVYAWRTIAGGRRSDEEEELHGLFFDRTRHDPPRNISIVLQVLVGLGLIVGGAQLFVTEVEAIAHELGISTLVLALILAPLASELPEKLNSVVWVRQGKDTLALGNITGAMVFQSTIPVAVGLVFTDWKLASPAVIASACALTGGALCLLTIHRRRHTFTAWHVAAWLALYLSGVGYTLLTA
jgi:cation:H+ antiporter